MSNEISFFWIPGLPICPVWKPFDDLKKKKFWIVTSRLEVLQRKVSKGLESDSNPNPTICRVDQKVHLGFSIRVGGKPEQTFWPIQY